MNGRKGACLTGTHQTTPTSLRTRRALAPSKFRDDDERGPGMGGHFHFDKGGPGGGGGFGLAA